MARAMRAAFVADNNGWKNFIQNLEKAARE